MAELSWQMASLETIRTPDEVAASALRMAAIVFLSLKVAGERDPELLLEGLGNIARELLSAQHACVVILDQEAPTTGGRAYVVSVLRVGCVRAQTILRSGPLADMLVARMALRQGDATWESLGLDLLAGDGHLSSLLGVPLFGSRRVRGVLLLANKLGADHFSDKDEELAGTFANHATLVYEKLEEQKRSDQELGASKEVFEALFELAPDAIVAANEAGRIVRVNVQTQSLFGYTREELVGQPVEILIPERLRGAHSGHREEYAAQPRRRGSANADRLYCHSRANGATVAITNEWEAPSVRDAMPKPGRNVEPERRAGAGRQGSR